MKRETVRKGLRAGCGALALVIVGAAGCSESGGDRVGSGPAERPPSSSPPASSPTAPSGTQETAKQEPGAGAATSEGGGAASPAPPAAAESGPAAKPDAGTEAGSDETGPAARSNGTTAPQTAAASGQGPSRVMAVQQALKDEGHDPGDVDGLMGPRTRQALRAFQTAEGLPATGRTDAATLEALGVGGGRGGG